MLLNNLPARRYASAVKCHGSVSVCLSVYLSVTRWYCIETAEEIELVLDTEAALGLSYSVFYRNSSTSKNKGNLLPSGTLSQTLN